MNRRATVLAIVLFVGCDAAPGPSGTASQQPPSPIASPPAATAAAQPLPSPTPVPPTAAPTAAVAVPVPDGATWQLRGRLEDAGSWEALVFDGRYLAYGQDRLGMPTVWDSVDGVTWRATAFGETIEPCPGWVARPEFDVIGGATNGERIVITGTQYARDEPTCGAQEAASWVSDDGLTWRRGNGFGGHRGFGIAHDVWPIDGGWETTVWTGSGDPLSLWRSADGLNWSLVDSLNFADPLSASVTGAPDGTDVMVISNDEGPDEEVLGLRAGESRLRSSTDGLSWKDVAFDFNALGPNRIRVAIERAPATGDAWIIVGDHDAEGPAHVWRSTDLQSWEQGRFPRPTVRFMTWTRYGYLAGGRDTPCGDGGDCPPNPVRLFLSANALDWVPFAVDIEAEVFVDGPAGLLAIDGRSRVWVLQ